MENIIDLKEETVHIDMKEMKNNKKKLSNYIKWLKNLVGERIYFEELTEDEVYKIILKISEITFRRNPILGLDHTYEDAAGIIYRNYALRDVERNLDYTSDTKIKTTKRFNSETGISEILKEEFPYYDERTGKYFKEWRPRSECKGFERMKKDKMTINHFSNLIFRELSNHYNHTMRDVKFYNRVNNTISLDYEDDTVKTIEHIPDNTNIFKEVEENTEINLLSDYIDDEKVQADYYIKIGNTKLGLSYSNLLKLYALLSTGKRVNSSEIMKHIIYKDNENLSKENVSFIGKFISSFKKYLLEIGVVNCTSYMDETGKEKKRYGFAEQLY